MYNPCAILVQTCIQYTNVPCGTVLSVPHTLFISAGFCFHASLGLKTLPQGTAQCNQGLVYGSQSAIHWRLRLMTPVLTDCYSERDAAARHAPHTHKL